jgi:hypothetical protein
MRTSLLTIIALPFLTLPLHAQSGPNDVSVCDLKTHPNAFDGKTIRVRSSLNVHFEDFTLGSADCDAQQGIWLAFGGDVPGIVASTVNDNLRKSGVDLKVNGVSYGITKDEDFHKLYALIAARHGEKAAYHVTATLTGTFFSGEEIKVPNRESYFGGYGHLGCCSLLVITQVSNVESIPLANLNLHGSVIDPHGKPVGGLPVVNEVLGGSPRELQKTVTDERGRFQFSNSGQLLLIEDVRYRPLALSVEPGRRPVRAKLEYAGKSDWTLTRCSQADSDGRVGFSILFRLPRTMESSPFDNDGEHSLFIFPHGSDSLHAELTLINDTDSGATLGAADSESGTQRWIKDGSGKVIGIDTRGRARGAGPWRTALFFPYDEAVYRLQKSKATTDLDRIIDSACVK